jgi:transcriptional regulator with XRE-family HTH domain
MDYITWYGFRGQVRLAKEAGVTETAVSRVVNGKTRPTYRVIKGITEAFERQLGRHIDPRDLFSLDRTYPTATVRELLGPRLKYFTGKSNDPSIGAHTIQPKKLAGNPAEHTQKDK